MSETGQRKHLLRVAFWAVQAPFAVAAAFAPPLERALFAYLVLISISALVESAATDYFAARREGRIEAAAEAIATVEKD
jgi:hypothetical protein